MSFLASAILLGLAPHVAYLALAGLVGAESMGVPLPGETAVVAAGVLASQGKLDITLVIVVTASAAIIGDNLGFWIGHKGGHSLLDRPGPFEHHRKQILEKGKIFFAKHGSKTVFFGRWFSGLRIAAAWLAGINRMPWRTFLFWNMLGGVAWATSIGLLAYYLGPTAEHLLKEIGVIGIAIVVIAIIAFVTWRHLKD